MKVKVAALVIVLMVAALAQADVVIKERIQTSGFMGMWSSEGIETTYMKGERIRNESEITTEGMMRGMRGGKAQSTVTIMRLDKGMMWLVNDEDSSYMEMTLEADDSTGKEHKLGFKVKDVEVGETGRNKKIAGHDCAGVNVKMTMETEHEAETISQPVEMLLWMAPKAEGLGEMRNLWERMLNVAQSVGGEFPLGEAMREAWGKMSELEGVPLGMEMTMGSPTAGAEDREMEEAIQMAEKYLQGLGGQEQPKGEKEAVGGGIKISREVISISEQKLEDSLFEVPAGYSKKQQPSGMFKQPGR